MRTPTSRYALLAGLLLTLVIVGLDLAGPQGAIPEALRSAGARLTGPVLTRIAHSFPPPSPAVFDATETQARLSAAEEAARTARASATLLNAPDVRALRETDHRIVLGRVVAIGALGPAGPERLTIDIGSEDGVAVDQTVVAATRSTDAGLVGRTVRVGARTSDVLILGAADLVVGARGADSGLLGTVSPPRSGSSEPRAAGQLTFAAIGFGDVEPGEVLRTVGSPGERPFVPGVTIGTVAGIDPSRGRVGTTAAVQPAVDVGRLDVVAVIAAGDG
ncbi:MAG TPA: hypothetical protein GXZ60_02915 [Intrasporangiaceae bacterium]|nr:hypothetical protein [Intrasporangiaceae bacterium]